MGLGLFIPEIIKKTSCFQRKYLFQKHSQSGSSLNQTNIDRMKPVTFQDKERT